MTIVAVVTVLLAAIGAGGWLVSEWRVAASQAAESQARFKDGLVASAAYESRNRKLRLLERQWQEADEKNIDNRWWPVWELGELVAARDAFEQAREQVDASYNLASLRFHQAKEKARPGTPEYHQASDALGQLHQWRYQEALLRGGLILSPESLRGFIEALEGEALDQPSRIQVEIDTEPSGAAVYVFRYEEDEEHLLPIPFDPVAGVEDPRAGLARKPFLVVERIWMASHSRFRVDPRHELLGGDGLLPENCQPQRPFPQHRE